MRSSLCKIFTSDDLQDNPSCQGFYDSLKDSLKLGQKTNFLLILRLLHRFSYPPTLCQIKNLIKVIIMVSCINITSVVLHTNLASLKWLFWGFLDPFWPKNCHICWNFQQNYYSSREKQCLTIFAKFLWSQKSF